MNMERDNVNRRLYMGEFSIEHLLPCENKCIKPFYDEKKASKGIELLKSEPMLFDSLFVMFTKGAKRLDLLDDLDVFVQEVNAVINTGYFADEINLADGIANKAIELIPFISKIDRVFWYAIALYYCEVNYRQEMDNRDQMEEMLFAWIALLRQVEEKEKKYGYTLNIDKIRSSNQIFEMITGDWSSLDKIFLDELTTHVKDQFAELFEKRYSIFEQLKNDFERQSIIAKKTENKWELFLEIVNDLSDREKQVIDIINFEASTREKIRAIDEYNKIIDWINKGHYEINDNNVDLLELFETINERFKHAPQYCLARTKKSEPFMLSPAIAIMAMDPRTYNYLFMTFHQFRLKPNKESAKRFLELALLSIRRNLGERNARESTIDDIVDAFTVCVSNYVKKHKQVLDTIKFNNIQDDAVVLGGSSFHFLNAEIYQRDMNKWLDEYEKSEKYYDDIENALLGKESAFSQEEVRAQAKKMESLFRGSDDEVKAYRIVISLNIIYMFCDALRIMLTNKHANIKIKKDQGEACRRELLNIDDMLVHKIYSRLDEREIGMLEYRERAGVITNSMSEIEQEEECYRNAVFSQILKGSVSEIVKNVELQNVEQLFECKGRIRREILLFPDCDEKDQYSEWLDSISDQLSDALISLCKQNKDEFSEFREAIIHNLGEKSVILPASSIDSLATAEMLFKRYGVPEYAEKGFDYSCISALYYQAFEDAYNYLIWEGYSYMLNSLTINGQSFTSIMELYKNKWVKDKDAVGYLDPNPKQRSYYIEYANSSRSTSVVKRCMYKSFEILMENIASGSKVEKFCDYFAGIVGFSSSNEMLCNNDYMKICQEFIDMIDNSVDSRNNASHGGTVISIKQCEEDRKTVLYDNESLKNGEIGLIQKILIVMKEYSK